MVCLILGVTFGVAVTFNVLYLWLGLGVSDRLGLRVRARVVGA